MHNIKRTPDSLQFHAFVWLFYHFGYQCTDFLCLPQKGHVWKPGRYISHYSRKRMCQISRESICPSSYSHIGIISIGVNPGIPSETRAVNASFASWLKGSSFVTISKPYVTLTIVAADNLYDSVRNMLNGESTNKKDDIYLSRWASKDCGLPKRFLSKILTCSWRRGYMATCWRELKCCVVLRRRVLKSSPYRAIAKKRSVPVLDVLQKLVTHNYDIILQFSLKNDCRTIGVVFTALF